MSFQCPYMPKTLSIKMTFSFTTCQERILRFENLPKYGPQNAVISEAGGHSRHMGFRRTIGAGSFAAHEGHTNVRLKIQAMLNHAAEQDLGSMNRLLASEPTPTKLFHVANNKVSFLAAGRASRKKLSRAILAAALDGCD